MESEFSPDKEIPPVPLKTYQWEDLKREREAGGYPWTYLVKPPLEGEITAEDIIRETTPRRSMSRDFSKSRTHSPIDGDSQKILNLDSSPGSSRKHGEEGEDKGVHIPNFSKEISLDSEDDAIKQAVNAYVAPQEAQATTHLVAPVQIPKNVSPKSILKRRGHEQYIGISESREKTKCCHPLVNKIKHLADKTLHKLEKCDNEKSPQMKRKKNEEPQEIRLLKTSPGAVRRQKFSAIKLGDSDEMSKTLSVDSTPLVRTKKEHIYEDIEESKNLVEKSLQFSADLEDNRVNLDVDTENVSSKENDSIFEKKSVASQDPSLVVEQNIELKPEEHIMEKLHKVEGINKEALVLDDEFDTEEPNVDEIFQNQLEETTQKESSPNIMITEITGDTAEHDEITSIPRIESSPSPQGDIFDKHNNTDRNGNWSKTNSDHEYEIIEKPHQDILYTASIEEKPMTIKTDDELSSTTSIERKYLQHASDEDDQLDDKENMDLYTDDEVISAEALQKNIEDRYFLNTPSTVSRTECEVSTSQVDSSALENLPLKRGSRSKNGESLDSKIQQRIREGTGKLKTQAGKLKSKLQNMKANMPDKPKLNLPDRPKFKMPERPKISFPERPKFTLPDKRKFSLPDRPKFKKINITEKLTIGDRKKFTLPERPKFNVPDLPKFKLPDRPKINFSSLGRKKEYKLESASAGSNSDLRNEPAAEFEAKTFPRLFHRKKKSVQRTSSSPTLDREDTPPPVFNFTRVKKVDKPSDPRPDSPEEPREYGCLDNTVNFENKYDETERFDKTYDYNQSEHDYKQNISNVSNSQDNCNLSSIPDISTSNQEYNHVINEIDNDEFFVRPRGISRENIQVREYLSDEIRQAFKIPKNSLALMDNDSKGAEEHRYANNFEADPELLLDECEHLEYSNEDLNDKDDGYYTFPPVRPSRAKRKKKELESVQYIDESVNDSIQFSEVDLSLPEDHIEEMQPPYGDINNTDNKNYNVIKSNNIDNPSKLQNQYENEEMFEYTEDILIQSQTLPMPPKRQKKRKHGLHSSLKDFHELPAESMWNEPGAQMEDIIVYRTEHEYSVPQTETVVAEQSPLPPRRSQNRSRSSRGTSLYDDDRTSQGADSLTLDTHLINEDEVVNIKDIKRESPGYATVDKGSSAPNKSLRRSKSKTPPVRRRKSNSSERKYYTVGPSKPSLPDRPPRKKSSTSMITLDSITKRSGSDATQYVEIDESPIEEIHKGLVSGEVISKMKDRPLPPPPRPPRGSRKNKKIKPNRDSEKKLSEFEYESKNEEIVEIEVSTQTDPLPDDVDYELGIEDNLDVSMSSSLRDIVDEDNVHKSLRQFPESPRVSRPASRSEKSFKISDPKISELSKSTIGRTSPTVILVERRVSSPTRINEREEMLTEASLTVQHIDVDESKMYDVPPLPTPRGNISKTSKSFAPSIEDRALERVDEINREIQLDNLITQRLQVRDLDVDRLNVSELQASKILVSDIEGMTLQVTELDSKSGHISVSGIEFSQTVIDEIVKKISELSTPAVQQQQESITEQMRPISREEETQTEQETYKVNESEMSHSENHIAPTPPPRPLNTDDLNVPPQRPPPPDLTPLLYSYLQDLSVPSASMYHVRHPRERIFTEFHESQHHSPSAPSRRAKRKPTTPHSESSSDDSRSRPSPRRMPPPVKTHEPTITEAGAQFFRVCQNSISRTLRSVFNSLMTYISGTEDKKDVQMALVIFLVLIAGLIMFGLSDSRTIHHHHWEFFNPPEGKP